MDLALRTPARPHTRTQAVVYVLVIFSFCVFSRLWIHMEVAGLHSKRAWGVRGCRSLASRATGRVIFGAGLGLNS
jgi:hypothetical protein